MIKRSREVLKLSKNSIYALHRGDVARAVEQIANAKEIARRDLLPIVEKYPTLRFGALSGALEEFAEACVFVGFMQNHKVPSFAELEIVNKEEYLGGIMDFTGELTRYAVLRATARDIDAVKRCRDCVDQLFSQLMLFEWRNGNLRRKYDALKYTLKKLEQIIYELTLASSGFVPKGGAEEGPRGAAAAYGGGGGGGSDGMMDDSGAGGGGGGGDPSDEYHRGGDAGGDAGEDSSISGGGGGGRGGGGGGGRGGGRGGGGGYAGEKRGRD